MPKTIPRSLDQAPPKCTDAVPETTVVIAGVTGPGSTSITTCGGKVAVGLYASETVAQMTHTPKRPQKIHFASFFILLVEYRKRKSKSIST